MRRILATVVFAAGFLAALAIPAQAKGAGQVVVTGPGLSKPIVIGGAESQQGPGPFWEFMSQTGVMDGGNSIEPIDAIGPRYRMTVYISAFDRPGTRVDVNKADRFTVSMYPYAVNGPWFHLPEGIHLREFDDLSGGWASGSSEAVRILMRYGLPTKSPVAFATDVPRVAPSPTPSVSTAAANAATVQTEPELHKGTSSSGVRTGIAVGAILALMVAVVAVAGRPRKVRL